MLRTIVMMHGTIMSVACGFATPMATPVPAVMQQPPASPSEKATRTGPQSKIDSQLLFEIYRKRGQAQEKNVPPGPTTVRFDKKGRALVDIRADVTHSLIASVKKYGGEVVSTSAEHHSIIARLPLLQLERLAADPSVRAIAPAAEPVTLR